MKKPSHLRRAVWLSAALSLVATLGACSSPPPQRPERTFGLTDYEARQVPTVWLENGTTLLDSKVRVRDLKWKQAGDTTSVRFVLESLAQDHLILYLQVRWGTSRAGQPIDQGEWGGTILPPGKFKRVKTETTNPLVRCIGLGIYEGLRPDFPRPR